MVGYNTKLISNKEELFALVENYEPEGVAKVKTAYEYAEAMHAGQVRKSGEPYIIHPLNVAYTVALMQADIDTVCAALLHDSIEDTKATKEEIMALFNSTVAYLVDGVTNLSEIDFSSKEAEDMANYRKVIRGIHKDIRIVIIKLADRLHNMRTLEYTSEEKRKIKANETLTYYAPLAFYLGSHDIKDELEDLSLKHLYPEKYEVVYNSREKIAKESQEMLQEMAYKINSLLCKQGIPADIIIRIKHIYGIYKEIKKGHNLYDIHDLLALKILVREIEDCYRALGIVHSCYNPVNEKFKDFIANPKTNMYRSLHTTVFSEDEHLVQCRIKTYDMDYVDRNGVLSYWHTQKAAVAAGMTGQLQENFQFLQSLRQMDEIYYNDAEFMAHIRDEIFGSTVYVHLKSGRILQLPQGSTPVDAAYSISSEVGDKALWALVNENIVPFSYELKNNDRVQILLSSENTLPAHYDWANFAKTTRARVLIEKREKGIS